MTRTPDPHHRHRFPAEIISHAVWLYHTFCLSFRDVELMLAERGRGFLRDGPALVPQVWPDLRQPAVATPTQAG